MEAETESVPRDHIDTKSDPSKNEAGTDVVATHAVPLIRTPSVRESEPMASIRKRGRTWHYRFVDADGVHRERKGCPDKRETEAMAAAAELEVSKIRAGMIDPRDMAYRTHEVRPLADHLEDWHRDMTARGKTPDHAKLFHDRSAKMIALVRGANLADIDPTRKFEAVARAERILADTLKTARLSDLTSERIQAALAKLRDAGKALQTVNHYRAALRAFALWAGDTGRLRDNPMRGVKGFNVEEDIRHVRRSLTDDELGRLIQSAERGPERSGMSGPLRAMAYRVAAATGFRVDELRKLTPESFRLTGPEPSIVLHASATKNRRPADQPVPLTLAPVLASWLTIRKPLGGSVFPLHHETARAIRADLAEAGIDYETDAGVADFHSLRGYYVSALVQSGATIKEVQTLARHAKPQTTLAHYAKVSLRDLRGAVESLPSPTVNSPEALAATGTDGQRIGKLFAHPLPISGDGTGRNLSVIGGDDDLNTATHLLPSMDHNSLTLSDLSASSRVLSEPKSGEGGIRTPGTDFSVQRFSKPSLSTTQPPLRDLSASKTQVTKRVPLASIETSETQSNSLHD